MRLVPAASARLALQLFVPTAGRNGPVPSCTRTCPTPTLSAARPVIVNGEVATRVLASGETIVTVGRTNSGTRICTGTALEALVRPPASVATAVRLIVPGKRLLQVIV